jgi:hypothetical protein
MPAIGSISFALDDGHDSGVAMLLAKPPQAEISACYGASHILASPNTPHVVCRFNGATSHLDAYAKGSLLLQEALDVLSMTGRGDLITREAQEEYLVGGTRTIALASTTTLSVSVGPVQGTVRDSQGNVIQSQTVIPTHHLGFRFYRLSQVSDDLFDAYRNMYLAFESLLSSRYPKGKELEITWLRSSLSSASADLSLRGLAPPSVPDPIEHILDVIYNGARLPLFHAKDGRAYFAPTHRVADREAVSTALMMLTHIVIRMADKWFNARRKGAWVNLSIFEEKNRSLFKDCHFVFSDNPDFSLNDTLASHSLSNGQRFAAEFHETFDNQQRHHVFGELDVNLLSDRGPLHALYLVNSESPLIGMSPDTTVDLVGFDKLQVLIFLRGRNASAPKYLFAR